MVSRSAIRLKLGVKGQRARFAPLRPNRRVVAGDIVTTVERGVFSVVVRRGGPYVSFSAIYLSVCIRATTQGHPARRSLGLLYLVFSEC